MKVKLTLEEKLNGLLLTGWEDAVAPQRVKKSMTEGQKCPVLLTTVSLAPTFPLRIVGAWQYVFTNEPNTTDIKEYEHLDTVHLHK